MRSFSYMFVHIWHCTIQLSNGLFGWLGWLASGTIPRATCPADQPSKQEVNGQVRSCLTSFSKKKVNNSRSHPKRSLAHDWFLLLSSLARTNDASHHWEGSRGARTFHLVQGDSDCEPVYSCKQTCCLGLCTMAWALGRTWHQPGSGENDCFLHISGAWLRVAFCRRARPTAEYREPIIKPLHLSNPGKIEIAIKWNH